MKRFVLLLALLPALALAAPGPMVRDLGQGLTYCRVHELPADLPPSATKPGPVVLDLRYTRGDDNAASALGAWLKFHASATTPVFVLLNADTASAVLAYFSSHEPTAGLVTLGAASSRFEADLTLKVSATDDRSAYDALEHGASLESLLTDHPGKPRHDEASIAQERAAVPTDEDTVGSDSVESPEATTDKATPPPIDRVLMRAVHLHRTLLALRHH